MYRSGRPYGVLDVERRIAIGCVVPNPDASAYRRGGGRGFVRAYKVRDRHFYIETEVGG